jgi:hypothetical protein
MTLQVTSHQNTHAKRVMREPEEWGDLMPK